MVLVLIKNLKFVYLSKYCYQSYEITGSGFLMVSEAQYSCNIMQQVKQF